MQVSTAACSALRKGRTARKNVIAASECLLWRVGYWRPDLRAWASLTRGKLLSAPAWQPGTGRR